MLEDGQPQTMSSFTLMHGGRTFNLLSPPPRQPRARRHRAAAAASRAPTTPPAASLLIFIDDLHFEPELSPHVRKVMQTIGDTLIHDGDLVAVLSSGPSFIEIGPTYDKKTVDGGGRQDSRLGLDPAGDLQDARTVAGPGDIRQRAQMAFYTAYSILGELERVNNKRKAVIYVSTGYDFDPFAEGRDSTRSRSRAAASRIRLRFLIDEDNPYFSSARSPPTSICTS